VQPCRLNVTTSRTCLPPVVATHHLRIELLDVCHATTLATAAVAAEVVQAIATVVELVVVVVTTPKQSQLSGHIATTLTLAFRYIHAQIFDQHQYIATLAMHCCTTSVHYLVLNDAYLNAALLCNLQLRCCAG
jgi:hypothetical protein